MIWATRWYFTLSKSIIHDIPDEHWNEKRHSYLIYSYYNHLFHYLLNFTAERFLRNLYSLSLNHLRILSFLHLITFFLLLYENLFLRFFSYLWLCHSFNEGKNNKGYWQDIMGSANYFLQVTSFNRLALVETIICIFCPIYNFYSEKNSIFFMKKVMILL